MKKLLFLTLLTFSISAYSQIGLSKVVNAAENWRVGGGVGLGFGGNSTFNLNISPHVGYMVAPNFELGMAAGYQHSSWKFSKMNLFSVGPYANFYPISNVFLRGHYEYFTGNHKPKNFDGPVESTTIDYNALWLGGGYVSGMGPVRVYVGAMYNVLFKDGDSKNIFDNGFRPYAGVSFGF